MKRSIFVIVLTVLLSSQINAAETIVFSSLPISKVESRMTDTTHSTMSEESADEYRVLITKRNGKYYWASLQAKDYIAKY